MGMKTLRIRHFVPASVERALAHPAQSQDAGGNVLETETAQGKHLKEQNTITITPERKSGAKSSGWQAGGKQFVECESNK